MSSIQGAFFDNLRVLDSPEKRKFFEAIESVLAKVKLSSLRNFVEDFLDKVPMINDLRWVFKLLEKQYEAQKKGLGKKQLAQKIFDRWKIYFDQGEEPVTTKDLLSIFQNQPGFFDLVNQKIQMFLSWPQDKKNTCFEDFLALLHVYIVYLTKLKPDMAKEYSEKGDVYVDALSKLIEEQKDAVRRTSLKKNRGFLHDLYDYLFYIEEDDDEYSRRLSEKLLKSYVRLGGENLMGLFKLIDAKFILESLFTEVLIQKLESIVTSKFSKAQKRRLFKKLFNEVEKRKSEQFEGLEEFLRIALKK